MRSMQNKEKNAGACADLAEKGKRQKESLKKRFSAKRLALMAVFTALAFVVSLLELPPIFPAVPFLKLDFGNVFILLISFLLGPIEGVLVCALKEGLRVLFGLSLTSGVGELANMSITVAYILLPSVVYRFKKGLKVVMLCLLGACLIGTGVALLVNRLVVFPAYALAFGGNILGRTIEQAFAEWWGILLAFNVIKTVSISVLSLLLYKRMSAFLRKIKI